MRRGALLKLFWKAIRSSSPLEGQGGEGAGHRVINMTGQASIGPEGDHHLGTQAADAEHEVANDLVEIGAIQFAVGVSEYFAVSDAEDLARGSELGPPELGQFLIALGYAAIAGGGAFGQAYDSGLNAAVVIQEQSSAKGAGFVIGVSSNAE